MNSGSLRCSLEFTVKTVTCPRAWLLPFPRPYVHVFIQVFDQCVSTRNVLPIFPLRFYDKFCVAKEYTWYNFWNILNLLADEYIQIILAQISHSGVSTNLATYQSNLLDFLFHDSATLPSYSEIEREIILTPIHKSFKSIIGPRLHLSIHALIEEFLGTNSIRLGIRNTTYGVSTSVAKNYCKTSGKQLSKSTPIKERLDLMEDRPPFVIRRVDSKLINRKPSLYKEFESKRAYCCYSPHRDGQCAACRMMDNNVSPVNHNIHRRYASGNEKQHKQSKLRSEGVCGSHQQSKTKNQHENNAMKPAAERIIMPSPEIARGGQDRVLPNPDHPSPRTNSDRHEDGLYVRHPRSLLFNRPTYNERFGGLALDSDRIEDSQTNKQSNLLTHLDQAQQTDYFYPINDDKLMTPYTDICRPLSCICHTSVCNNFCSCPYCPTYWRYRFDSPLRTSRSYWRDFHSGLSCIYDDLHHLYKVHHNYSSKN